MNLSAQAENVRTLAAVLGVAETEAAKLLDISVVITFDEHNMLATQLGRHVEFLISRTVQRVLINPANTMQRVAVELIIGAAMPRVTAPKVVVSIAEERIVIGPGPVSTNDAGIHPVGLLLGACYAVGAILKKSLGHSLPFPSPEFVQVDLAELIGSDLPSLYESVCFDEAYLAGAGAVGNAFVLGLSQFKARGILHVADDDTVCAGNLQRCVYFEEKDVGLPKADLLCSAVRIALPEVRAIPHKVRLQDVPSRTADAWLKRLVVGVDSPRARRSLQSEIPRETFDASTTGISEVVLHFNKQPTNVACMSCIYAHSPEEGAHEHHVAETLGVSVSDVRQIRISEVAALAICRRYPQLKPPQVMGLAYDTLFKQLCSTGSLNTSKGREVLTPFAFISALAGVYLAIEFV
jgi:hypothetical protein